MDKAIETGDSGQHGHSSPHGASGGLGAAMALAALGVVYGDLGTSPLYALKEAFHALHGHVAPVQILGILSLIFWSLVAMLSVKYIVFVLRADNHGEGGILALTTLVNRRMPKHRRDLPLLMFMGTFGAALLYGDGMLTPAISVLSAVEGLKIAAPALEHYVVPITAGILIALFSLQYRGTEKVGKIFGPVLLVWFATIALVGLPHIFEAPEVLWALVPIHAVNFLLHNGWASFGVLGSVFLVMTGGEAMYADLGHFGAKPIRVAWFTVVLPGLLLCYFGQGANLLRHPEAVHNPFFMMVPPWFLVPMIALATVATVIASQALISGTFSVTTQALQLKYLPRLNVEHTSERLKGQIYVPFINWALMVCCVGLVVIFQNSSNLAAAYGVAVTLDMVITTTLLYFFLRYSSGWPAWKAALPCGFFMSIESVFLAGNVVKIPHGGWIPLLVAALVFMVMSTWRTGRKRLAGLRAEIGVPLETLVQNLSTEDLARVPGTAVFLHPDPSVMPPALLHNIQHNQVLHRKNLVVAVTIEDQPYVPDAGRARVEEVGHSFYRVMLRFGYMDRPDVPKALHDLDIGGERFSASTCSYFVSRETILPRHWLWSGMGEWRERIFALMARNAEDATAYFCIPPTLVMEVGSQIEI